MSRALLIVLLVLPCGGALGDMARYTWRFQNGSDEITLGDAGDTACIEVLLTIDNGLAGWHYRVDAEYDPPDAPGFLMTGLWVMPEGDYYGSGVPAGGDIDSYSSFADIVEQQPGIYYLPSGTYLIERLTIESTGIAGSGEISFDPVPLFGYNVLNMDFSYYEEIRIPDPLTVHLEGATGTGDYDSDGDVDLADFAHLQGCFTGEDGGAPETGCNVFRFDADQDVDLDDFAEFAAIFTGPVSE